MRRLTLGELQGERDVVLDALHAESASLQSLIRDERATVMNQVRSELSRAMQQSDEITQKRTAEAASYGGDLIDHFFWRMLQCVGGLAAAALLFWIARRRMSQRDGARANESRPGEEVALFTASDDAERRRAA